MGENSNAAQRKYIRAVLIVIAVALVIWLAAVSMAVLAPFLVGILLAYMLMPIVTWLESILPPKGRAPRARRVLAIAIVFILFTVVLVLFLVYIGASLIAASGMFMDKTPELISQSIGELREWASLVKGHLPNSLISQLDSFLAGLGPTAGKFIQDFIAGTMAVLPASMPTIVGFMTLPFFLFFVLNDYESFQKRFYEYLPPNAARHAASVLAIIGTAMGRYLRSQLILGVMVGGIIFIGLALMKIDYAPMLGVITVVTQFIPIVGPLISALLTVVITFALEPDRIVWVLLLVVGAQVLVNMILVNWIQGKYMQIHPAVIMVLLVVGGYVGGLLGAILALPVGATVWEIFKYFRGQNAVARET
jgi:predicted PurR-regulated permease PerM